MKSYRIYINGKHTWDRWRVDPGIIAPIKAPDKVTGTLYESVATAATQASNNSRHPACRADQGRRGSSRSTLLTVVPDAQT